MPADGTAPGEVVHWFDLRTVPATPWKNGGGVTYEIARWPEPSAFMAGEGS